MNLRRIVFTLGAVLGAATLGSAAAIGASSAQPAAAAMHATDSRQLVHFPPELRRRTLASMRLHLQGLAEIELALAAGHAGTAAEIATMKLGMSAMHGAQMEQEARYMPPGMRALGARLHQQAAAFAVAAQDAQATGDTRRPAQLLGELTQTCVACHAAYRLQ